jgi:hypothetical protein
MELSETDQTELLQSFSGQFDKYYTLKEFKDNIKQNILEAIVKDFNTKQRSMTLNQDKLYTTEVKLTLKAIEELYNIFTGKTITEDRLFHLIFHHFQYPEE